MDEINVSNTVDRLLRMKALVKPSDTTIEKGSAAWQIEQQIIKELPPPKKSTLFWMRVVDAAAVRPRANGPETDSTAKIRELAEKAYLKDTGFASKSIEECVEYLGSVLQRVVPPKPLALPQSASTPSPQSSKKTKGAQTSGTSSVKIKKNLPIKWKMIITVMGDKSMKPSEIIRTLMASPYAAQMTGEMGKAPFTESNLYMCLSTMRKRGVLLVKGASRIHTVAAEYKNQSLK